LCRPKKLVNIFPSFFEVIIMAIYSVEVLVGRCGETEVETVYVEADSHESAAKNATDDLTLGVLSPPESVEIISVYWSSGEEK